MAANIDEIMRLYYYILLLTLWPFAGLAKEASEHGLVITLHEDWRQLKLGPNYRGVAAYCDEGIIEVLIERKPFDRKARVSDIDRQMVAGVVCKDIDRIARYSGKGVRKSGVTAEGDAMSYTLFYPEAPWDNIVIFVICGTPSPKQLKEMHGIIDTLRQKSIVSDSTKQK